MNDSKHAFYKDIEKNAGLIYRNLIFNYLGTFFNTMKYTFPKSYSEKVEGLLAQIKREFL
jgi:hypothetical protein